MYGQMLNQYYYAGDPFRPFQPSSVPLYRQQPYPIDNGRNGFQLPPVNPYAAVLPMANYPLMPEINPHYLQVANGFQQGVYNQPNGTAQHIFQNPLNPSEQNESQFQQQIPPNGFPFMNPYPKGTYLAKQPSGIKTVLNSFKAQDGSLDINKMVDTAGQMINAVSQVSSVVKGFGGMFKA